MVVRTEEVCNALRFTQLGKAGVPGATNFVSTGNTCCLSSLLQMSDNQQHTKPRPLTSDSGAEQDGRMSDVGEYCSMDPLSGQIDFSTLFPAQRCRIHIH